MVQRSRVALLRTTRERVLDDYGRLFDLAGAQERGLGTGDPRDIEVIGDTEAAGDLASA